MRHCPPAFTSMICRRNSTTRTLIYTFAPPFELVPFVVFSFLVVAVVVVVVVVGPPTLVGPGPIRSPSFIHYYFLFIIIY